MDGSYFPFAVHGIATVLPKTIDWDMKKKKKMEMNMGTFPWTFTNLIKSIWKGTSHNGDLFIACLGPLTRPEGGGGRTSKGWGLRDQRHPHIPGMCPESLCLRLEWHHWRSAHCVTIKMKDEKTNIFKPLEFSFNNMSPPNNVCATWFKQGDFEYMGQELQKVGEKQIVKVSLLWCKKHWNPCIGF